MRLSSEPAGIDPENFRLAGGGRQEIHEHLDCGGLAGAVGPEQAEDLATPHPKTDMIDREEITETADEARPSPPREYGVRPAPLS